MKNGFVGDVKDKNSNHSHKGSKDDLGWAKNNKEHPEDEKHDEERSLLDPHNDKELYSNELVQNQGIY